MASAPGRGAQVRLRFEHQRSARGATGGSFLDNILAKYRQERGGDGDAADGLGPDGSPWLGREALDEVLTPGGRLDGYVPGQPAPPPAGSGSATGSAALRFGAGGTATALQPASTGSVAGFSRFATSAGGTARGLAPGLAGSSAIGTAAGGTATGATAAGAAGLRGEAAARFSAGGTLTAAGPIAGSAAIRFRVGSGIDGGADLAFRAGGTARGLGALAAAGGAAAAVAGANSSAPANSSAAANSGSTGAAPRPTVVTAAGGTARGLVRAASTVALSFQAGGTATGVGGEVVGALTVTDRDGAVILLRDGTALEMRPEATEAVTDRDGNPITLRDGSPLLSRTVQTEAVYDRDGNPILLRDGTALTMRAQPDPVEAPPSVVEPAPDPGTTNPPPPAANDPPPYPVPITAPSFPAGRHLLFQPSSAAAVVQWQDGRSVYLRLVRPLWESTIFGYFDVRNAGGAQPTNIYTSGGRDAEAVAFMSGGLIVARTMTSADDGSYEFIVYRNLDDGSYVEIHVYLTISDSATASNPKPAPAPAPGTAVFFEPFTPGRGTGALIKTWQAQRILNTQDGTLLLDGSERVLQPDGSYDIPGCSCMTLTPWPVGERAAKYGFGYGLFEFRARFLGNDIGERSGPAIILWPADDVWPGQEWDLGEIMGDGTFYHARHWRDPATGQDKNELWAPRDQPAKFPNFNHRDWHVHALKHEPGRVTFLIDGTPLFSATENLEPDFAGGGVNHTVGLQSGSAFDRSGNRSGLECDWIRWTPLALLPP